MNDMTADPPAPKPVIDVNSDGSVTVTLAKPLVTHKGVVSEIRFREPSAGDYISMRRTPFSLIWISEKSVSDDPDATKTQKGEMSTDYELVFKWAARLSGHEILILQTLKGVNFKRVVRAIRDILGESDDDGTDADKTDNAVKN